MKGSIKTKRNLLLILLLSLIGFHTFCTQGINNGNPYYRDMGSELPLVGERPLFKDFMGINGHFTFKPELYNQVCRLVRNYHDINWDVEKPGDEHHPPYAANGVNWKNDVYGYWKANGFETDICLQFSGFNADNNDYKELWKDQEQWSYTYGKALA